jgi:hypothetical protein
VAGERVHHCKIVAQLTTLVVEELRHVEEELQQEFLHSECLQLNRRIGTRELAQLPARQDGRFCRRLGVDSLVPVD